MNKEHLIQALLKVVSTRKEATRSVEKIFSTIREGLRNGDKVVISGFGSFRVSYLRPRKCRNPKTGETILVKPRRKVRFKPAKDLI